MTQFADAYAAALTSANATLIEIRTDRQKNAALHKKLRDELS